MKTIKLILNNLRYGFVAIWLGLLAFSFCVYGGMIVGVSAAHAAWTPLITSADFTGIQTDVGTVAAGIISICLIVIGLGLLVKVLSR